jgi:hypothetical protein
MKTLFAALLLAVVAPGREVAPPPRVPVLVELFTSEGCSSCPPADALLAQLQRDQPIANAEIIPLGLHVDYWDRLGWKDKFSSAAYTARQQSYSKIFGEDRVYTPQLVVDGRQELVGNDGALAQRAIAAAAERPHLSLRVTATSTGERLRLVIDLPAAPQGAEGIDVLAAVTQHGLTSEVRSGENRGKMLAHVAVVRKVQSLGSLNADAVVAEGQWKLERAWGTGGLNAVVWLQGKSTRQVYGAATVPIAQ